MTSETQTNKEPNKKEAFELLNKKFDATAGYHHHKEMMAYLATALFLSAATIVAIGKPFWMNYSIYGLIVVLFFTVVATILTFLYVRWQLNMRLDAAAIVGACWNLMVKWLTSPPSTCDLQPVWLRGHIGGPQEERVPRVLQEEYNDLIDKLKKTLRMPKWITFVAIFIWGFLVIFRVLISWFRTNISQIAAWMTGG